MTSAQPTSPTRLWRMARRVIRLLTALVIGVLLAWIIGEVLIRAVFGALPSGIQIVLSGIRRHPFTEERLASSVYASDNRYQNYTVSGVVDRQVAATATVRFTISTYAWNGGRVGFRSAPPADGTATIVALGDSHTFCFTDIADCWTERLAERIRQPVFNLGQSITGSLSHTRIYEDFVLNSDNLRQQPEVVIWQFYGNDFNDDYGLAVLDGTLRPTDSTTDTKSENVIGDSLWLMENSALYVLIRSVNRPATTTQAIFIDPYTAKQGSSTIRFGRSYLVQSFDMRVERNLQGEQLSQAAILSTRDQVVQGGGRLLIVTIPTKEEVYAAVTEPQLGADGLKVLRDPVDRMLGFCTAQNLICLDLLPALQAAYQKNPDELLYFADDIHLTPAGNAVVAKVLAEQIKALPG